MIGRIEASLEWGVTVVVAIGGTVFYQSYWFVLIERLKIEFYRAKGASLELANIQSYVF